MDEKNKYTGMDILDLAQMAPESVFDEARKIFWKRWLAIRNCA